MTHAGARRIPQPEFLGGQRARPGYLVRREYAGAEYHKFVDWSAATGVAERSGDDADGEDSIDG
jgi:hypothetical protein